MKKQIFNLECEFERKARFEAGREDLEEARKRREEAREARRASLLSAVGEETEHFLATQPGGDGVLQGLTSGCPFCVERV